MGLFVSITRYTPEQVEGLERRWETVVRGTAPKVVLDAFAKMKVLAYVASPQNGFSLMITEVTDQTWLDGTLVCRYMADVAHMDIYPVVSMEDYLKLAEMLPRDKIPK